MEKKKKKNQLLEIYFIRNSTNISSKIILFNFFVIVVSVKLAPNFLSDTMLVYLKYLLLLFFISVSCVCADKKLIKFTTFWV